MFFWWIYRAIANLTSFFFQFTPHGALKLTINLHCSYGSAVAVSRVLQVFT